MIRVEGGYDYHSPGGCAHVMHKATICGLHLDYPPHLKKNIKKKERERETKEYRHRWGCFCCLFSGHLLSPVLSYFHWSIAFFLEIYSLIIDRQSGMCADLGWIN